MEHWWNDEPLKANPMDLKFILHIQAVCFVVSPNVVALSMEDVLSPDIP
jgi:hypothetical protein